MAKTGQHRHWISAIHWLGATGALALLLASTVIGTPPPQADALSAAFSVLHRFGGLPDGMFPLGSLFRGLAGNLYGTTFQGGVTGGSCGNLGCGVVFKLDPTGKETVLYRFTGGADGALPSSGVIGDRVGNLYGTTFQGGGSANDGVVFKLDPTGKETVLFTFGFDGGPSGLTPDRAGNVYGTTAFSCSNFGCFGSGTVFKLDPTGKETVLYRFAGAPDGLSPDSGVIRDFVGNLYGTTGAGGNTTGVCPSSAGCGVVFKLDPAGHETVLYSFTGGADGSLPSAGLFRDLAGNLYGTTTYGGITTGVCGPRGAPPVTGCGVVFKLDPTGKETVLYSFTGGADGAWPLAGVIRDSAGNLYGTTSIGGVCAMGFGGWGVVFKLDPAGHETVLHSFAGGPDGNGPSASLIPDRAGNLYGTTVDGGVTTGICAPQGCGVVFKLTPY
jgi:uncharacterized repeat protein (TIGR03803 family)